MGEEKPRVKLCSWGAVVRIAVVTAVFIGFAGWFCLEISAMPGESYRGPSLPLTSSQEEGEANIKKHVYVLCNDIGSRSFKSPQKMERAAAYIADQFNTLGYRVTRQYTNEGGVIRAGNIVAEKLGKGEDLGVVIVGAHYDSFAGNVGVGADDNASGVAGVLEIARRLKDFSGARTVRFVAFADEEPPFFRTELMGSSVYARGCKSAGEKIAAMLCLEMIGYYDETEGSQQYPYPLGWVLSSLYPSKGDFIAFVGNFASRRLTRQVVGSFREFAQFPSEGVSLPEWVSGSDWSDHLSFWREGYPAVMVTDTALYRNPWYHTVQDVPERLDYSKMALVTEGLSKVVENLAR